MQQPIQMNNMYSTEQFIKQEHTDDENPINNDSTSNQLLNTDETVSIKHEPIDNITLNTTETLVEPSTKKSKKSKKVSDGEEYSEPTKKTKKSKKSATGSGLRTQVPPAMTSG